MIERLRAMVKMIDQNTKIKSDQQKIIKIIAMWKLICDEYGRTLKDASLKRAVSYELHTVSYEAALVYIYDILDMYQEEK